MSDAKIGIDNANDTDTDSSRNAANEMLHSIHSTDVTATTTTSATTKQAWSLSSSSLLTLLSSSSSTPSHSLTYTGSPTSGSGSGSTSDDDLLRLSSLQKKQNKLSSTTAQNDQVFHSSFAAMEKSDGNKYGEKSGREHRIADADAVVGALADANVTRNVSEETLRTENDLMNLAGAEDIEKRHQQRDGDATTRIPQDSALTLSQVQQDSSRPPPPHKSDDNNHPNNDNRIKVDWDENDPLNPYNWSLGYKCWINVQLSMLAFSASLGSSIIAPANATIATYTHVSREVSVLSVSLYVIGFAIGPLLWAPVSEIWGRRVSMLPALACLGLFSIGTATSKNAAAVFLTRFFGGVFGSAPVSNVSAAMGDIWNREQRGTAVTFYAIAVVGGPTLGPVIGSALLVGPGWRWTEYLEAIIVFAVVAISAFCLPEVYGPVLLKKKAQKIRKETGDMRYYHPHEETKLDLKSIITKQLSRPLLMLFTEPMVAAIAFYASFVFSLLYLTLEVFPIVFEEIRGYPPVVASLPFLALLIGVVIGSGVALGNQPRYIRKCRAANGRPVPEARCPPMAIGGIFFTIGLFWFGWTASPSISWVSICFATIFIGMGFNSIFQQCINFLIDTYGIYAASATAANTFLRSIMAAGLPLAARPMFSAMGVGPAMSVLGAVAAVMMPMPFVFMKYGAALRRRSKFAPIYD